MESDPDEIRIEYVLNPLLDGVKKWALPLSSLWVQFINCYGDTTWQYFMKNCEIFMTV